MNIYLLIAGLLCLILGLTHSILGEILIFKNKRKAKKIVPSIVRKDLKESHLRIIWATWHLTSFFGLCIATLLLKMAVMPTKLNLEFYQFTVVSISIAFGCSSILVLIGTKGKHLAWIVLLSIAILSFLNI